MQEDLGKLVVVLQQHPHEVAGKAADWRPWRCRTTMNVGAPPTGPAG